MPFVTFLCATSFSIILDQATKVFVLARLRPDRLVPFGPLGIRPIRKYLVFAGSIVGRKLLVPIWFLEFAVAIAICRSALVTRTTVGQVALGAAFGGASGNMLDCLWRGGVIDFLDFGFWPVFNLADLLIVTGGSIAVLSILFRVA